MTTTTLTVPTVHNNGTSKERLIEALCEATNKLREACTALGECTPNGRDYYVQGNTALGKALDEHRSRLQRIDDVRKELDQLAIAIDEQ